MISKGRFVEEASGKDLFPQSFKKANLETNVTKGV
jgi:hypothetical protein